MSQSVAVRSLARRLAARLASAESAQEAELRAAAIEVRAALAELAEGPALRTSAPFGPRVLRQPPNPFEDLKPLMSDPEMVVLCQGVPPHTMFPLRHIELGLLRQAHENGGISTELVHIGEADTLSAQRYPPFAWGALKTWIEAHVREVHVPACADWGVTLAAGSMSSVDLGIGMFFEPGDSVLMEEFSFLAAVDAFTAHGVTPVPVAGDEHGLNPSALRAALQSERDAGRPQPRALYAIPVGQNPSGTRLSETRYSEIYAVCREEALTILEDDAYFYQQHNAHDDRPDGDEAAVAGVRGLGPTSFLSVDTDGIVLRMDSFSKFIAPGFRLGWVAGPKRFVDAYDKLAYASSQNGCSLAMVCLGAMLRKWGPQGLESHVRCLQVALRRQCRSLLRACDTHLQGVAEWRSPRAGMFLWLRLVGVRDFTSEELLELMRKHRVVVLPGAHCASVRVASAPYLRLSYVLPESAYDEGMRRLRRVLDALQAQA